MSDCAERPYFEIAGDLLADFIAFGKLVEARRPEIAAFPGTYHLTIDAATGIIWLAKVLDDSRAVIVERVLVNPSHPEKFGASELPIVVPDDVQH